MLNSLHGPSGLSDGPDLRCTFGIASHDSFSCNYKANRLVTLSSRRGACIAHAGSFEIGVFSLSLCWLVDGISRVMLVSVAFRRRLYGSHGERGPVIPGLATRGKHHDQVGVPAKD